MTITDITEKQVQENSNLSKILSAVKGINHGLGSF